MSQLDAIVAEILQRVSVNGAVGATIQDVRETVSKSAELITKSVEDMITARFTSLQYQSPTPSPANVSTSLAPDMNYLHTWGGKFHPVPEHWELKVGTVKAFWDLWFHGQEVDRIKWLRTVVPKDDLDVKYVSKFSKGKHVLMKVISSCEYSEREIVVFSYSLSNRNVAHID